MAGAWGEVYIQGVVLRLSAALCSRRTFMEDGGSIRPLAQNRDAREREGAADVEHDQQVRGGRLSSTGSPVAAMVALIRSAKHPPDFDRDFFFGFEVPIVIGLICPITETWTC